MLKKFGPYLTLIVLALAISAVAHYVPAFQSVFTTAPTGLYLVLALIFGLGFSLNALAPKTAVPSFVWAIFFGMALQPVLIILTKDLEVLRVLVELLAALVLFGGGIEIPFVNFKKYFGPIASLSLLGTLMTAVIFSFTLEYLAGGMGIVLPAAAFVLVSAILCSTDPTAIIPSLQSLKFRRPFIKDIAVSESAVNDVIGTMLTRFFLVLVLAAAGTGTVFTFFKPFFTRNTADTIALEIVWGIAIGLIGAWILLAWTRKAEKEGKPLNDPALLFSVPIFTYALGSLVGGSGFLAAFVSGLIFETKSNAKEIHHFFDTFIDKFIKPIIFILLGAIVPLQILGQTATLGILAALVFMFIIRPLVVFITLLPWSVEKKALFHWRELLFLSFIRETGVIPAVLILVAVGSGVAASEHIFAIGMWVILLTLIIEPPLTPIVARTLEVAEPVKA